VRDLLTRLTVPKALLALLGCGSESASDGAPPQVATATPAEPSPTQPRSDVVRCTEPPDALVTLIATDLTVEDATLRDARAVVSAEHDPLIVFVSAEVDGEGIEGDGEIGTWALRVEEDGYGRVYAVGGSANAFSHWAGPRSTLSMDAEGARVSVGCVRSA
jgi:hypothetical protein